MAILEEPTFGIVDYCVFIGVLALSMAIGVYASLRGNTSPDDFLTGNRDFGPIPVAMSLQTSFISAIAILGYTGETYAFGLQIGFFLVGALLGIATAAVIALPVIHPLKLTSVNEYLELRFKSVLLRKTITVITSCNGLLYMGICLYAPTLALATVTPISSLTYIFILGFVVTIYSSIGGIRAVVWTDVFQLVIMISGLTVLVVVGMYEAGGFTKVWNTALAGGRLDIFNTDPSLYTRHNIYNTIAMGFFSNSALYSISQINVQRLCIVPTIEDAKKVLWLNAVGIVILFGLVFGGGIAAYAAYDGCDPLIQGVINKKEEIIPYFVIDRLAYVTGLPGVFVATLIGGALSSLSSVVNALVAMTWQDLCSQMKIFANIKPRTAGIINKIFSFAIGLLIIGLAIMSSQAESLIQFTVTILSVAFGPVFGVFLIGLLFPKTNLKGVWTGLVTSMGFVGWIAAGAYFYNPSPVPLSFSVAKCSSAILNASNFQNEETSTLFSFETSTDNQLTGERNPNPNPEFPLMMLYKISYTLYCAIGTCSCIFVGLIVSCLTGNYDLKEVSPNYVSPIIRKLYWKKEVLDMLNSEEQKIQMQTLGYESDHNELEVSFNKI